jgi:hypothetical protein
LIRSCLSLSERAPRAAAMASTRSEAYPGGSERSGATPRIRTLERAGGRSAVVVVYDDVQRRDGMYLEVGHGKVGHGWLYVW